ncbi:phosphotransferase family protein [Streptomyces sp. NPDC003393]
MSPAENPRDVAVRQAGAAPHPSDAGDQGARGEPDTADVVAHLRARGLVGAGPVTAQVLSGGVSNDVVAVEAPGISVVVKRALRRLRVAEEWLADPSRVLGEAKALQTAARYQPHHVPAVLDVDEAECVIVIGRAERDAHEWKADLLRGRADTRVAAEAGKILAGWHRRTAGDAEVSRDFADTEAFEELRVDPFYRWTARRHPDLAPRIESVLTRMNATRACLVHGDFSPKNVLISRSHTWVIDWEVAHYGDPCFDVAFLVTHLLCKALYRPASAQDYHDAASRFLHAYHGSIGPALRAVDQRYLTAQTACLLLARMDGKSPVPYLDEPARERGRALARAALGDDTMMLNDVWTLL